MFQEDNIEKLIEEIEMRPPLYDKYIEDYANISMKKELWKEVCASVVPGWNEMSSVYRAEAGREVQKKWQNLRSCFSREIRAQKQTKGGRPTKRRKYIYFDKLLFLLPMMDSRSTETHTASDGDEEEAIDQVIEAEIRKSPQPNAREEKKLQMKRKPKTFKQSLLNILNSRNNDDEDVHFVLSLVPSLKKLGAARKIEARIKILKVVQNMLAECSSSALKMGNSAEVPNVFFREPNTSICKRLLEMDKGTGNRDLKEDSNSKHEIEQDSSLITALGNEIVVFAKSIASQMKILPKSVCIPLQKDIQKMIASKSGSSSCNTQQTGCVFEEVFVKHEMDIGEVNVEETV